MALFTGLAALAAPQVAAAQVYWPVFKLYVSPGVEAGAVDRDLPGCTRCDGASATLGFGVQFGVVLQGLTDREARKNDIAALLEIWGQTLQVGSADEDRWAVQLTQLGGLQFWLRPRHQLSFKYGVGVAQLVSDGVPGTKLGLAAMVGSGVTLVRAEHAALDLQARLGFSWFGDGHTAVATVGLGVHWP